jgi:hypothetical protein
MPQLSLSRPAEPAQPLRDILLKFVKALGRIEDDPLASARGRGGPSVSWRDEEYQYLEVELPEGLATGIDINFLDNRAFIRIER